MNLNRLVRHIVELENTRLTRYTGDYERYLVQREANEAQWLAAYENQQKEIERLMRFVDRFRAKNTKATQASKLKQIERMEKIEAPPYFVNGSTSVFPNRFEAASGSYDWIKFPNPMAIWKFTTHLISRLKKVNTSFLLDKWRRKSTS